MREPIPKYEIGSDIDLDEEVVLDANGQRITEQDAEDMAAEALEKARAAGRPSLSGGARHSPQVAFRVPEQLGARAAEVAQREGKTISQLGREALEQYLNQAEPTQPTS